MDEFKNNKRLLAFLFGFILALWTQRVAVVVAFLSGLGIGLLTKLIYIIIPVLHFKVG